VARIGAAIAYFISRRGAQLIVIERHEAAGAASGKSGGFLALDWCGGIRTRALMAGRTRIDLRLRVLWGWGWVCAVFFRLRLGTATRCSYPDLDSEPRSLIFRR
jgi:glycine/D-amino acid oxidase-like deaminating enzyme